MGEQFHNTYKKDGMNVDEHIELSDRHLKQAMLQVLNESEDGIENQRVWEIIKENADRIEITKEL